MNRSPSVSSSDGFPTPVPSSTSSTSSLSTARATTTTTTRKTIRVSTTLHSTSTAFSTSKIIVTIGQGTTSSSDIVIATPVVIQVPTVIEVDESPDPPTATPDPGAPNDPLSPAGGPDPTRGLADGRAATGAAGMSPRTKVVTALAVGTFALVAVVVGTLVLRRLGARERKGGRRTSRSGGSVSLGSSSTLGSSHPPGAITTRGKPWTASGTTQALAPAAPGHEKGVASGMATRASLGASLLIPLQPLARSPSPGVISTAGGHSPAFQPLAPSPIGVPIQRLPPPSPSLLTTTPLPGRPATHVSRPIVGLGAPGRETFVEWELPPATQERAGSDKRVRWEDGVEPGKDY